jgi:transposase InsO family protein
VIRRNAHKYGVSAQCRVLGISRGSYYYEAKQPKDETLLEEAVQTAFEENRSLYGSRKIKKVLSRKGITLSRRKICRIMKYRGLESAYTRKKYRNHNKKVNEAVVPNLLGRQFDGQEHLAAVVSDQVVSLRTASPTFGLVDVGIMFAFCWTYITVKLSVTVRVQIGMLPWCIQHLLL